MNYQPKKWVPLFTAGTAIIMSSICQVLRSTASVEVLKVAWYFLYCIFQLSGFIVNLKTVLSLHKQGKQIRECFCKGKLLVLRITFVLQAPPTLVLTVMESCTQTLLLHVSKYMLTRDGQICFLVHS